MRILSALVLTITIILGVSIDNASAVSWNKPPVACLPDRAEIWENSSVEPEPCHCPPQDEYCPNTEINPEDIEFRIVARGWWGAHIDETFNGRDILNLDIDRLLGVSDEPAQTPLQALLETLLEEHGNFNWNNIGNVGARNRGQSSFRNVTVTYTIIDADLRNNLDALRNDTFTMPAYFVTRCCESICPAGTVAVNQELVRHFWNYNPDIQPPRGEGGEEITSMRELNNQFDISDDEYQDLRDQLQEYLDHIQEIQNNPNNRDEVRTTVLACVAVDYDGREGCVQEGTEITLEDGSAVKVEDIKLGDKVMSKGKNVTVLAINKFTQNNDEMYGINGGEPFISVEHPILTTTGWKAIDPEITSIKSEMGKISRLKAGDEIVTKDGTMLVESIDKHKIENGTTAYNLSTSSDDGFVANGIFVKDFHKVQIHY